MLRRQKHTESPDGVMSFANTSGPPILVQRKVRPNKATIGRQSATRQLIFSPIKRSLDPTAATEENSNTKRLRLEDALLHYNEADVKDFVAKSVRHSLSVDQTIQLQVEGKFTDAQMNTMRSVFNKFRVNCLSPAKIVRRRLQSLKPKIKSDTFRWIGADVRYAVVDNINDVLNNHVAALQQQKKFVHHGCIPPDQCWLQLIGDKGGHSVKVGVNVVNNSVPLSRNNMLILLVWEGKGEDYEVFKRCNEATNFLPKVFQWARTLPQHTNMKARIFIGGDFPWLSMLHGRSQLGKSFCLHCQCTDDDLEADKGKTHSSTECKYNTWTYWKHEKLRKQFLRKTGGRIEHAKFYGNCINPPLLDAHAYVCVAVMVLHVFLGIGHIICAIISDLCVVTDLHVIQQCRLHCPDGGSKCPINSFRAAWAVLEDILFTSSKSKRQNQLVGNDVHQLLQPTNIKLILSIFSFRTVCTNSANFYGAPQTSVNNLHILFTLVRTLYVVCTAARGLSAEEIVLIRTTTHNLADHYGKAYPNRSITPKLHMLTHHFPEFAEKYHTIGLLSEHSLESTHSEFKNYDKRFKNSYGRHGAESALVTALTQNHIDHDARIGRHIPFRRICPRCHHQIANVTMRDKLNFNLNSCTCLLGDERTSEDLNIIAIQRFHHNRNDIVQAIAL
jgi:hypothetical protein